MHRLIPLAALLTITLVITACSNDGRTLRPPNPNQTLSIVTTTVPPSTTAPTLSLILPFADGGTIDARYTCKAVGGGSGISPGVSWGVVPAGTVELALVVTDPDAGGFVHWVLAGIDPNAINSVPEGAVPAGLHQATNSFGKVGWSGPCPPSGTHHYVFTLHALSEPSGITDGMPAAAALNLINGRSVAKAVVTATFGV
jgi:Raf kinase inhibitor-like YbhB/YbcL family protein